MVVSSTRNEDGGRARAFGELAAVANDPPTTRAIKTKSLRCPAVFTLVRESRMTGFLSRVLKNSFGMWWQSRFIGRHRYGLQDGGNVRKSKAPPRSAHSKIVARLFALTFSAPC